MGAGPAGVDGLHAVSFVELARKNALEAVRDQLRVMAGDTVRVQRVKSKYATGSYVQVRTTSSGILCFFSVNVIKMESIKMASLFVLFALNLSLTHNFVITLASFSSLDT